MFNEIFVMLESEIGNTEAEPTILEMQEGLILRFSVDLTIDETVRKLKERGCTNITVVHKPAPAEELYAIILYRSDGKFEEPDRQIICIIGSTEFFEEIGAVTYE